MENIFQRFPHIGEAILSHLDNENLVSCNGINQDWQDFIGQQKLSWIRMIKKYVGSSHNLPDSWLKFLPKTPINIVKAIALDVKEFYTAEQNKLYPHDGSPFHITAACGNLKVCKYIYFRISHYMWLRTYIQTHNIFKFLRLVSIGHIVNTLAA